MAEFLAAVGLIIIGVLGATAAMIFLGVWSNVMALRRAIREIRAAIARLASKLGD